MCEDCVRPTEAVLAGHPPCGCRGCTTPGSVLAVERPPESARTGLGPWCISCHHFIGTESRKGH